MHKDDILTLYDYNYWATARVLNAAAKLTLRAIYRARRIEPWQRARSAGAHLGRGNGVALALRGRYLAFGVARRK